MGPLKEGDHDTCEVRKMYFLPVARGLGLGREILSLCLQAARKYKFKRCYLETVPQMKDARRLYDELGFEPLAKPLGNTGHCACSCWYTLALGSGGARSIATLSRERDN